MIAEPCLEMKAFFRVTSLTPGKVTSVEVSFVGINNFGCVVWKMALKGSEETRALSFASEKEKKGINQQVAQESIHKRAWGEGSNRRQTPEPVSRAICSPFVDGLRMLSRVQLLGISGLERIT